MSKKPTIFITILAAALVVGGVGVGLYLKTVFDADNAGTKSTASPSVSASAAAGQAASPSATNLSDEEQITNAVRAYNYRDSNDSVSNITIIGNNAKGNAATPGAASGYLFIAHKANGVWALIYRGQELPTKSMGTEYQLPDSWYSKTY